MNKTLAEARSFAQALRAADQTASPRIQRFVLPPFTAIREVKQILAHTRVKVGAQTMHWADEGAWTGEISPRMLKDCHLDLVELGHSERREYFNETNERVGLKVEAAIRHGLTPLICVGETAEDRRAEKADARLERQVESALSRLSNAQKQAEILFAYEPVWAIGDQGIPASPAYADARQKTILDLAGTILGRRIPCLYGGSVSADNCEDFLSSPHVQGLFIGRAAWQVEGYLGILEKSTRKLQEMNGGLS